MASQGGKINTGDEDYIKGTSLRKKSFYFPKINSIVENPNLQEKLNEAQNFCMALKEEKSSLLLKIQPLKEKFVKLEDQLVKIIGRDWRLEELQLHRKLNFNRQKLQEFWPETIDEDLEHEPDPDIELIEIKEKIPKLRLQFSHGKNKINRSLEKQSFIELEHLLRRKEVLERQVKAAEAKIPANYWQYRCSKYETIRFIRKVIKEIKEHEAQMKILSNQNQQVTRIRRKIVKLESELAPFEKRYNVLKEEEERTNISILELQNQIRKEIDANIAYCKQQTYAQKLANEKNWGSLDELCLKVTKEFMSRWKKDDTFRAKYTRISQISLASRGLSNDGRIQEPSS